MNAGVLADLPTKIFQMNESESKNVLGRPYSKAPESVSVKSVAKIIKMSGIAYKMRGISATCVTMSENE